MNSEPFEWLGKIGVILFIIVLHQGPDESSIIFRMVTMLLLACWFVPGLITKNDGKQKDGE